MAESKIGQPFEIDQDLLQFRQLLGRYRTVGNGEIRIPVPVMGFAVDDYLFDGGLRRKSKIFQRVRIKADA